MVGRPQGTTKDPNRRKVINPNGRKIDYEGPQYNKLIRIGYKLDEDINRLIKDPNFAGDRNVRRTPGKPKGSVIPDADKVKNPDTGRMIIKTGVVFKNLSRKYYYNENKNKFITKINDPKSGMKIRLNDEIFNKRIKHGYIYDDVSNTLTTPSIKSEKAFKNGKIVYDLYVSSRVDPEVQISKLNKRVVVLCKRELRRKQQSIKLNLGLDILFSKPDPTNGEAIITNTFNIKTNAFTLHNPTEIKKVLKSANEELFSRIDRFTNQGSGWSVTEIIRHYSDVVHYSSLSGRSYIKLPDWIQNKKATINIKNKDNKCFIYCLGRALDPNPESKHLERVSKHLKKVCTELGLDSIKLPVSIKDIPKIEDKFKVSINLYGHNSKRFSVIRTTETKHEKHVDLLYTDNDDREHYVFIKNFNRLNFRINKKRTKSIFVNTVFNISLQMRY
jgi:hypothetical protein